FYDGSYTSVTVSTNGFLHFAGPDDPTDPANSADALKRNRRIAVLWDDLRTDGTGNDIFVDTSVGNQVTIRWVATNKADGSPVNFAIPLFRDGHSRLDYGGGNANLTPTVGVSYGNGTTYTLPTGYDGAASLTNVKSISLAVPANGTYEP